MGMRTSLIDIVKDSCNNAFETLENLSYIRKIPLNYLCSEFRCLVFNELAENLLYKDYKFTQVYDCFIEIYIDEFYEKLLNI